jgi:hypothetical protein
MAPPNIQRIKVEMIVDVANEFVIGIALPDEIFIDMTLLSQRLFAAAKLAAETTSPAINPMELN